jgi:hypothetical protein
MHEGCETNRSQRNNRISSFPKHTGIRSNFIRIYGRNNDATSKIPHRKLANCVIEIPQRNLRDIRPIFNKYDISYQLRIAIPERDPEKIVEITDSIEDAYRKALNYDSIAFSTFLLDKLDKAGKPALGRKSEDELLVTDTADSG